MLILLDTANIDSIKHINDIYPLDGVTTNPTIISKEKKRFYMYNKGNKEHHRQRKNASCSSGRI